jgi:hypothetical protein
MADELAAFVDNPALRERTIKDLAAVKEKLGRQGATINVARLLEEYFR